MIGLTCGAIAAFGCGYDFWIICGATSGVIILFNINPWSIRKLVNTAAIIFLCFFIPFLLRQIHVAAVMGISYWAQDFYYSTAIKIPYANRILTIPSLTEIDAYYRQQHVIRPPAQPGNTIWQIFYTFRHMIAFITIPRWGWLSLLALGITLLTTIKSQLRSINEFREYCTRLITPIFIGSVIGLIIFAPFSLHVYFKHEFPLIAFPLLIAKGAIIYRLIKLAIAKHTFYSHFAIAIIALFIVDASMVHWNNSKHGPALNFDWTSIFLQVPKEKIALTTTQLPHANDYILNTFLNIDTNRAIYVTAEEVISEKNKPLYWVYQPTARFVDFHSPYPRCEWTGWLRQFLNWKPIPKKGFSCIYGIPLPSGIVPQPSLTEITTLAKDYEVIEQGNRGIGYVIFRLKKNH